MSKFATRTEGFQITFDNGLTVSVQFGDIHYCSHDGRDAEVAVIRNGSGGWVSGWPHQSVDDDGKPLDDVQGFLNPSQVLDILNWAARQK